MEINIMPKFLDAALTPIAKESGERLADIISLVFTPIIKTKAKRDKNIELFLKELDKEVKKIPENKIQEPPLHIVAPTLELVYKYYCDEKYLRNMFAKLIASSMDSDNIIHPSYIEIIKQLSHNDAIVFKSHFEYFNYYIDSEPQKILYKNDLIFYHIMYKEVNCFEEIECFLFGEKDNKIYVIEKETIISLCLLKRLGLVNITLKKVPKEDLSTYKIRQQKLDGSYENILIINTYPTEFALNFAKVCCDEDNNIHFINDKSHCLGNEVVVNVIRM